MLHTSLVHLALIRKNSSLNTGYIAQPKAPSSGRSFSVATFRASQKSLNQLHLCLLRDEGVGDRLDRSGVCAGRGHGRVAHILVSVPPLPEKHYSGKCSDERVVGQLAITMSVNSALLDAPYTVGVPNTFAIIINCFVTRGSVTRAWGRPVVEIGLYGGLLHSSWRAAHGYICRIHITCMCTKPHHQIYSTQNWAHANVLGTLGFQICFVHLCR